MATRKRKIPWGYADWTRFMPQNAPLAELGGINYQLPGLLNYQAPGSLDYSASYPTTYGGLLGGGSSGAADAPPVTYTPPPRVGSTDSGGNTITDSSGAEWVLTPGGQLVPADSDQGKGLLGTGRLFIAQHYDSSGNYMGAEGESKRSIMAGPPGNIGAYGMVYVDDGSPVPASRFGTAWQDTPAADWIRTNWGINEANPYGIRPGQDDPTSEEFIDWYDDQEPFKGVLNPVGVTAGDLEAQGYTNAASNPWGNSSFAGPGLGTSYPGGSYGPLGKVGGYGIDARVSSGYDVAAGYNAYDNAMNAAARRTAAAGGVPWGSDYAGPISALSSSNQVASDAAAFHANLTRDEARNGGGGDRSAGRGSFREMDVGYAGPK